MLSATESGLTYGLTVDDGTGTAAVKIWISDDGGWHGAQPSHLLLADSKCELVTPAPRPPVCLPHPFLHPSDLLCAESESDRQRRAEWRPGMYVRVHGHISSFGKAQEVIAFNIRPVVDHNEVRLHARAVACVRAWV